MDSDLGSGDVIIKASVGRHLAFAPVAFAVTEGRLHSVLYANTLFKNLLSSDEISIGSRAMHGPTTDLTPVLDRVFRSGATVRDELLPAADDDGVTWSCTVWPVPGSDDVPQKLVIEVRDVAVIEAAKARQRAVTEQLLLGALRQQDIARDAVAANDRAQYLSKVSRELSMSLDESATRNAVRRLSLPRPGTWCIVDVCESNGGVHRLAVLHPDPEKQELARRLEDQWPMKKASNDAPAAVIGAATNAEAPTVVTDDSSAALMLAAHGEENLRILRQIGFGALLVVPLVVRARIQGAITFVSPKGDAPFNQSEIALAVDVAARCAMALDNARLYREADALKLAAELANKSKSEFLGSMSHELRTPLNAIGGFADLLDMELSGPITPAQHESLARIKANQQHLLGLITEILNFVRIESGRMEYRTEAVSMPEAMADVVSMLSVTIHEKGFRVTGPAADAKAVAFADPARVRQILVNLVMNAVKYSSSSGGTVTLSCATVADTVVTDVLDTGPGIPAEKLELIFEPFVQLTSGLTDRRGGVGLGLAISRDLARAMNGDLTAQSTAGVGSRFTLTLPRARSL